MESSAAGGGSSVPWGSICLVSRRPEQGSEARPQVAIPCAVLWREGPDCYFSCAQRFAGEPAQLIDLGPLSEPVYVALIDYLLADVIRESDVVYLSYAADVFLMDRLSERLRRLPPTPGFCLNCRTFVVRSAPGSGGPCRHRPARRLTPEGLVCSACDRTARDCRCLRRQALHALAFPSTSPACDALTVPCLPQSTLPYLPAGAPIARERL